MENRRINNFKYEIRNSKTSIFSLAFLIFIVLISIFAFLIPINPDATDTANMLQSPSIKPFIWY